MKSSQIKSIIVFLLFLLLIACSKSEKGLITVSEPKLFLTDSEENVVLDTDSSKTGIIPPRFTKLVKPEYPEYALENKIEGKVVLKILVGNKGELQATRIIQESGKRAYGFEEACVMALEKSELKPALFNQRPMLSWSTYEVEFKIK